MLRSSSTFLTPGKRYKAEIYRDGDDADYRTDQAPFDCD